MNYQPSSIEELVGNNPIIQNTKRPETTLPTGIPGSKTNRRVKAFASAILKMERENPEEFQEKLTKAILKK